MGPSTGAKHCFRGGGGFNTSCNKVKSTSRYVRTVRIRLSRHTWLLSSLWPSPLRTRHPLGACRTCCPARSSTPGPRRSASSSSHPQPPEAPRCSASSEAGGWRAVCSSYLRGTRGICCRTRLQRASPMERSEDALAPRQTSALRHTPAPHHTPALHQKSALRPSSTAPPSSAPPSKYTETI